MMIFCPVFVCNTWINKSRDGHIDGVANKSSVWFFMSTNLQKIPVEISWHSNVWSTSYSDLTDASLDILKTMDSKLFLVLIYHCFLMKKKHSATVSGMLSLNVVVQTSPIRLPACNGKNLLPLVIIVSMCKIFSPERVVRVTLYKSIVLNGCFSEKSVIKYWLK